jgi:hypothetical protein
VTGAPATLAAEKAHPVAADRGRVNNRGREVVDEIDASEIASIWLGFVLFSEEESGGHAIQVRAGPHSSECNQP